MTSTSDRTVSYRKLCEFLWNTLGVDPDNVFEVHMYPDKVSVGQYARNEKGGLVIRMPERKVVVEEVDYKVAYDGD